jgi:hypothetical protein
VRIYHRAPANGSISGQRRAGGEDCAVGAASSFIRFCEQPADRAHPQPKQERLVGQRFEFVPSIEALRLIILGIDQHSHDAYLMGDP